MTTDRNKVEELIKAEMRKVYSATVVDHAINPRNMGRLEDADGFARFTGSCGDTIEIWLRVKDDTIADVAFMTDGCSATIAAGSMITEMVRKKNIAEAQRVRQQDVLTGLDGLPEGNRHCALLAVETLKKAIADYLVIKRNPWKKGYRKY